MKNALLICLACVVASASLSGKSLALPPRPQLEKLVGASEVIAVASATFGPEKTRIELTEILWTLHDAAKKRAVIEVERAKPNDGAHPAFDSLIFFPAFPPKGAEFTGLPLDSTTLGVVKDIIAKKRTNQMPEPTPDGVAHR